MDSRLKTAIVSSAIAGAAIGTLATSAPVQSGVQFTLPAFPPPAGFPPTLMLLAAMVALVALLTGPIAVGHACQYLVERQVWQKVVRWFRGRLRS